MRQFLTSLILLFSFIFLIVSCGEDNSDSQEPSNKEVHPVENSENEVETERSEIDDAVTESSKDSINTNGETDVEPYPMNDTGEDPGSMVEVENEVNNEESEVEENSSDDVAIVESEEEEEIHIMPPEPEFNDDLHKSFDALLKKYVTSSGKVNYRGFKSERSKLKAYMQLLGDNQPENDWKYQEKLAYWINVYNAFMIDLILDHYPVSGPTAINNAWKQPKVKLGSNTFTLDHVENGIIRPRFGEPRIHFAVNCAAKSCPKLLDGAFMPSKIYSQLDRLTRSFINSSNNQIGEESVKLSQIFNWYRGDFEKNGTLIDYINKYSSVKAKSNAKVEFIEYNWGLNE